MTEVNHQFVDSPAQLEAAIAALTGSELLAIDTEFVRETTYYPIPALIQLSAGETVYLVDPTRIDDFEPVITLLQDKQVVKIMHSCVEDLEVFMRLFQALPEPLFDTQIAASLSGLGFSLSYSKLVEQFSGRELDKAETRSNWLQRPLTPGQANYAAEDVHWLPLLYRELLQRLEAQGRSRWCVEDCQRLVEAAARPLNPDAAYLRLKNAWRLKGNQLANLQTLCAWREREAIRRDVPRGRVIGDATLMELAQSQPVDQKQLAAIKGIGGYTLRKYAEQLLSMLAQEGQTATQHPPSLPDKKSRPYRELIKAMQNRVQQVAATLEMPIEMLGRKRDLEDYLQDKNRSLIHNSWRAELIAHQLDEAISTSDYLTSE